MYKPLPIHPVLEHYGARVNPVHGERWRNLRCPFHEDHSASAQYTERCFRCFTCDLFFASPIGLIMWKEGLRSRDALAFYSERFGDGDNGVSDTARQGGHYLPGFSRVQRGHGKGVPPGRRPGAATGP